MKLKKLLAGFMAACMVATAVPVTALAETELPDAEDGIINVTDNIEVIGEGNSMTVELDNETIQFASGKGFIVAKGGTLEITGTGTISEVENGKGNFAPIRVYGGGTVAVDGDITLEGWAGIMVRQQGQDGMTDCGNDDIKVTLTDVTLKGVKDSGNSANGLYVNGGVNGNNNVITLNNPEIISASDGIYQAGNVKTKITGGSITGDRDGIVVAAGTMEIDGTNVTAKGEGSASNIGGGVDTGAKVGNALIVTPHSVGHKTEVTVKDGVFDGAIDVKTEATLTVEEGSFTDLANAVKYAESGATITLLDDVTLTDSITIEDGMDVTIEGSGKTITGANDKDVFYVKGGKLTLSKGLNVHAPTDCVIYIRGGEVITSANLTKAGEKYSVIQGNGQYSGDVTINGGEITNEITDKCAIYWPQDGKLTINDGTITGGTALRLSSGSLKITGGTLIANGAKQDYVASNGGSVVDTGDAVMIENIGGNSGYEAITNVSITGGTFISKNAASVGSYTAGNADVEAKSGFVSGGNFSSSLLGTNYLDTELEAELTSTGDAPFSYHKSVEDAVKAGNAGDTVVGIEYGENGVANKVENSATTVPTPSTSSNKKSKKYDVIIKSADNGDVEVDDDYAKRGQEITITVDPDKGYELDELTITDQNGDEVDYEEGKKDNTFVFDMPKSDVTIEASFDKESSSVSDQDDDDKEDVSDKEDEDTSKSDDEQEYIRLTIGQKIVWLFDEYVVNDVAPEIKAERTMLPIRIIAEALGATVTWSEAEQKVTITEEDLVIEIFIDQPFATVDGEPVELDAPAYIANDRTYLPLRFVAENLGAEVVWNAADSSVTICK